jgi:hypothetical protein
MPSADATGTLAMGGSGAAVSFRVRVMMHRIQYAGIRASTHAKLVHGRRTLPLSRCVVPSIVPSRGTGTPGQSRMCVRRS